MNSLNLYAGKKVLVTGHTGFKGTWLTSWLLSLGANVVGISDKLVTTPSHYQSSKIFEHIQDIRLDIRNNDLLSKTIVGMKPDFIFHLAAQSLVKESYSDPVGTIETNTLGTVNLVNSLRTLSNKCTVILITSDKSYENVEWEWGYREIDRLGGVDPYSASKGATELLIQGLVRSFFPREGNVRIATARAGNVIGGGDWAKSRIIPDCIRAWAESRKVEIRNPHATRPWQHVLEPLSGYMALAIQLANDEKLHGEVFNFGPKSEQDYTVLELVEEMRKYWDKVKYEIIDSSLEAYESGLLKLNCDKAAKNLNWRAVLNFVETVEFTSSWYSIYYNNIDISEIDRSRQIFDLTRKQINTYTQIAKERGLKWAL